MLKQELNDIVSKISKELTVSLTDTENIIKKYIDMVAQRHADVKPSTVFPPICSGIAKLDSDIAIHPGITVIHSHPDMGRTSIAKRMAMAAYKQGKSTVYYDVENKLMIHNTKKFEGILLAQSYQESGLKELVSNGLIDCMIVDTITGINHTSQESFVIKLRKHVPYIILTTQMRESYTMHKPRPAAREYVLSAANTIIELKGKEKIVIENVSVMKVQYNIAKYEADPTKVSTKNSLIIRNNLVDNIYSIYDDIRSKGHINSIGRTKYIATDSDDIFLGAIKEIERDPKVTKELIDFGIKELGLDSSNAEVYFD